jgi:hypothetical protein
MSPKNSVTPSGINPGTTRLVAQRLDHYATPGPPDMEGSCKCLIEISNIGQLVRVSSHSYGKCGGTSNATRQNVAF